MNRGIQSAAIGMKSNQLLLDVVSNNLANLDTIGFKRDGVAFADLMEQQLTSFIGNQPQNIGSLGHGPQTQISYSVENVGPAVYTSNPLDVMLTQAKHYFTVETPNGIKYTRDGGFRVNDEGLLVTRDGFKVIDIGGNPIQAGFPGQAVQVEISRDGKVILDGVETAILDIRTGNLRKVGKTLYEGNPVPVDIPEIMSGALEGSNVSAIDMMVQMISLMRSFESAQRAIRTHDEMTERLLQSLTNR